jgi:hypothetical protein
MLAVINDCELFYFMINKVSSHSIVHEGCTHLLTGSSPLLLDSLLALCMVEAHSTIELLLTGKFLWADVC